MKKILSLGLIAVLSTTLLAVDKKERISDMRQMATGMELIMNGLLYNYPDTIYQGTAKIKGGVAHIKSEGDLKNYLPKDTAYAYKFAQKSLRRITEYAGEIDEALKQKDFEAAFDSSALLMRQCNSCHSRVRGW